MINTIAKRLKLNVTNIKSSLISNQKKIKKINSEKNKFVLIKKNQEEIKKKESKIESSSGKISPIQTIGKKLLSGPLSLIDKFKEFFGLILLGIVVNNLPTIIKNLQNILGKIKDFFDKNPQIGNAIKFGFKVIGNGLLGLVKFIKFIKPYVGGSFKFALDTIKSTKNDIGNLIETFDDLDYSITGLIRSFTNQQNQQNRQNQRRQTSTNRQYQGPGGAPSGSGQGQFNRRPAAQRAAQRAQAAAAPSYDPNTGTTKLGNPQKGYVPKILAPLEGVMGAMEPGKPNTWARLGNNPALNPSIQRYNTVSNARKLASGGTVGNTPSSEGTGRGGPSDVAKTSPYLLKSSPPRNPFARPGGTAIGRRTIRAVNYFENFKNNVSESEETSKKNEENNNSFFKILKKLNEIKNLRLKVKDDEAMRSTDLPPGPRGEGPGGGISTGAAEVFEGNGADRVWNFFKGKGLSDIAVSGIMGNAQQESGFSPTAKNGDPNNPNFVGIFQWDNKRSGDRWGQLVKWAQKKGLNPESLDTQLKWTWEELSGPEALSLREIKKAQSPEEAAQIWYEKYERASHGLPQRQSYAKGFYTKYKGKLPKAITDLSQSRLPSLPPTNTYPGQFYGAPRDDNNDGVADRRHAGVDYDISGNDKFYSRIGGEVIRAGFRYGADGYGVDIYNPRINMTERIAEGRQVLVRVGDTVVPGDAVVQGESNTGVIHYELRRGKAGPGGDYAGTVNPVKFLEDLGAKQNTQPVKTQNLTPLAEIKNITDTIKQPEIEVGVKDKNGNIIYYKIEKDGNKLKFSKKIDPFGLFEESIDIEKGNTEFLKDILNELRFKTKKPVEPGTAAASLITPTSKSKEIASIGSGLNQQNGVVILNRTQPIIVKDVQTIAMTRTVQTDSGNNNSSIASRIFAGARDSIGV